ncbi:MAG: hypothetical protein JXB00_08165 [Bacteroidales bacterium]|nr:hypothetical protein [Bacteroidales bacterium]
MNESFYSDILRNDFPGLEPDAGIQKRLEYAMQLKAGSIQPSENSLLLSLKNFFTLRHFAIKAGIITSLLILTIIFREMPINKTTHSKGSIFIADSSHCDSLAGEYYDSLTNGK